jgi:Flp pilus assembly pilin Flp
MTSRLVDRVLQDESGVTGVEYGVITGLLSLVGAAVWNALGSRLIEVSAHVVLHLGFSGAV